MKITFKLEELCNKRYYYFHNNANVELKNVNLNGDNAIKSNQNHIKYSFFF
jgi:hypothetical protein